MLRDLTEFPDQSVESLISSWKTKEQTQKEQKSAQKAGSLEFLNPLKLKNAHQPTFLQAVEEMAIALLPLFEDKANGAFYKRAFMAMTEPERAISFRVSWTDDEDRLQFNRGWRVEFSSVLGPYKGKFLHLALPIILVVICPTHLPS